MFLISLPGINRIPIILNSTVIHRAQMRSRENQVVHIHVNCILFRG